MYIDTIKDKVYELLCNDDTGHDISHVDRVLKLSLKFAKDEECDEYIVSLIALLHDVDDYKLFGKENSNNLGNAKSIMNSLNIDKNIQEKVLSSIKSIGYSKSLNGIRPTTIEGKIVSDADMCDALGVNGILRTYKYSLKKGKVFFDKDIFPIEDLDEIKYTSKCSDTSVCHIFEKILKLKKLMLTRAGIKEAEKRHQIILDVLYQLFDEENVPEWKKYLDNYIIQNYNN
jgi:uncharacterized protein